MSKLEEYMEAKQTKIVEDVADAFITIYEKKLEEWISSRLWDILNNQFNLEDDWAIEEKYGIDGIAFMDEVFEEILSRISMEKE